MAELSNALWNYGPEGAPTDEAEDRERAKRRLWRCLDRQLAFIAHWNRLEGSEY